MLNCFQFSHEAPGVGAPYSRVSGAAGAAAVLTRGFYPWQETKAAPKGKTRPLGPRAPKPAMKLENCEAGGVYTGPEPRQTIPEFTIYITG